jgi:hypothetical protein
LSDFPGSVIAVKSFKPPAEAAFLFVYALGRIFVLIRIATDHGGIEVLGAGDGLFIGLCRWQEAGVFARQSETLTN